MGDGPDALEVWSCDVPRVWKNILSDFEFNELKSFRLISWQWNDAILNYSSFLDKATLSCFTSVTQVEILHTTKVAWRNVICKDFGISVRNFSKVGFFISTLELDGLQQLKYLFPIVTVSPNLKTLKLRLKDDIPQTISFGTVSKDSYVKLPLIISRLENLHLTGSSLFRKVTETLLPKELKHLKLLEINDSVLHTSSLYRILEANSNVLECLIIRNSEVNLKWLKNVGFIGFPMLQEFWFSNCWLLDENSENDVVTIIYGDKKNNHDFVQAINIILSSSKNGLRSLELDCKTAIIEPSYQDILENLSNSLESLFISLGNEHSAILQRVPLNVTFHIGSISHFTNLSQLCIRQEGADDPGSFHECPRISEPISIDGVIQEIVYFNRINLAYIFSNIKKPTWYLNFTRIILDGIACDSVTLDRVIPLCKNLHHLYISPTFKSSSGITDNFMLNCCTSLTKLITLSFRNSCVLTDNGLENVHLLLKLEMLRLNKCCQITNDGISKSLPQLRSLKTVDLLDNTKISIKGIQNVMKILWKDFGKTVTHKGICIAEVLAEEDSTKTTAVQSQTLPTTLAEKKSKRKIKSKKKLAELTAF